MLNKSDYIKKHGEEAWKLYLEKKRKESHVYYQTHRAAHTKSVQPANSRKAEFNCYTYYVTEDGQHFYNANGKERPIQINKNRQNRKYLRLNHYTIFFNKLMAIAFPDICGEWFDGCEVHHIDGNQENDAATNLKVMTREEHHRLHDGIITKYTMDGEKVGEYLSSKEAAESVDNKVTSAAIRECLCGVSKSCAGYIWKREP